MVAQVTGRAERRSLPPSERAFDIYRMIEVDGQSTRVVAQQVGLSQTRVVQLRDSVECWMACQPTATTALSKQQRLQAAEYKAGLRLDHLYSLALEAFRQSQGFEATSEESPGGKRVVKTRYSHGNTRYLSMAMRVSAQQSRIPIMPMPRDVEADDAVAAEVVVANPSPPKEDCSLTVGQQEHSVEAVAEPIAASSEAAVLSDVRLSKSSDVSAQFAADFFPVQTDIRVQEDELLDEPVLTRKQRKRRARMLAALQRGK